MPDTSDFRTPPALRLAAHGSLALWMLVAAFPLAWTAAMSLKLPVDAFASNPLRVLLGPATRESAGGLSIPDIALGIAAAVLAYRLIARHARALAAALGWVVAAVLIAAVTLARPSAWRSRQC